MADDKLTLRIITAPISRDAISEGLREITRALEAAGYEGCGVFGGADGYGVDFRNGIFSIHPFCWCEDQELCPWCAFHAPNFVHYSSGLKVFWYKHIGRDTEIVCSEEVAANWPAILRECLESIEKKEG